MILEINAAAAGPAPKKAARAARPAKKTAKRRR